MKNIKDVKFYIGPMTQNVIDSVIEVVNEKDVKLGFCTTTNQIDYDRGYVGYTTSSFINYVNGKIKNRENLLIERDHAGHAQGGRYRPLYSEMKSLEEDVVYGVDIIHIDPWKGFPNYDMALRETINNIYAINLMNPNVMFEVGTEEAIYHYDDEDLYNFLSQLEYELGDIFTNIKYAVIQSGTKLKGTENVGKFDLSRLHDMISACKDYNLLSKEHNGDYLTDEELKLRFENGLDAINIAPEFGVIETKILIHYIKNNSDFEKIYDICYKGNNWVKWTDLNFKPDKNKIELIEICGHYHNKQIKEIVNIDDEIIKKELKEKIYSLINLL
jgi:hypothetical protein